MIFIGKRKDLFSDDKLYDRESSHLSYIGVAYEPARYRIRVKGLLPKVPPHISRWQSIRLRARKRGYEFNLTGDDVLEMLVSSCIYCGNDKEIPQIDRKDSSKGYTKENTVPACRRCNTIKNNVVTYEEMMKIVEILGWRV